jgi:hypothetical protein
MNNLLFTGRVRPGLELSSRLFCRLQSQWKEHKKEQLWCLVRDNSVPTPEKPFVHHPWVEQVAQIEAQLGDVPESGRAVRGKKISWCKYVDDMAEEVLGGNSDNSQ